MTDAELGSIRKAGDQFEAQLERLIDHDQQAPVQLDLVRVDVARDLAQGVLELLEMRGHGQRTSPSRSE